jgi:hypothetical protein
MPNKGSAAVRAAAKIAGDSDKDDLFTESGRFLKKAAQKRLFVWVCSGETTTAQS